MEKVYAIGDVHGEYDKLVAVMQKILDRINPSDTVEIILLGDLIDRGPHSIKVLRYLKDLQLPSNVKLVLLKGNHEDMFLRSFGLLDEMTFDQSVPYFNCWIRNGGEEVLKELGDGRLETVSDMAKHLFDHIDFELVEWLSSKLLKMHTIENLIFVHAGYEPFGINDDNTLFWRHVDNPEMFYAPLKNDRTVVFGHRVYKEPNIGYNYLGIDTGSCFGGKLTAAEFKMNADTGKYEHTFIIQN